MTSVSHWFYGFLSGLPKSAIEVYNQCLDYVLGEWGPCMLYIAGQTWDSACTVVHPERKLYIHCCVAEGLAEGCCLNDHMYSRAHIQCVCMSVCDKPMYLAHQEGQVQLPVLPTRGWLPYLSTRASLYLSTNAHSIHFDDIRVSTHNVTNATASLGGSESCALYTPGCSVTYQTLSLVG